ncbi:MAG: hypothetical protein J6A01_11840 [Proteobacteria bacterium]|nr:hypothetical protein [Pseudomonadota bacterium]
MIQAFVSLKSQQPPRTESGMRSFFEALQGAVFSQPTVFRTNADASVRPYSLDAVCEAALNPRCKFVVLRAECERFWQCTFLLPDKQGMGALFFDLQRQQNPRRLSADSLIEMFKKLYRSLTPRLIRIGDSEAREKLKSRHGLVMMPSLGRIEWLQIVSPEVYSETYNPSELIAAPGYQTEIWDDGALFMRVYDDPNDWDSEDNISQANFIPGFLAGVARIRDPEKEKETLRELERIWTRAEKTAEKAYEVLDADPDNVAKVEAPKAAQPVAQAKVAANVEKEAVALEGGDEKKLSVVYTRLKADFKVDEKDIVKCGQEGPCTIFKVKAERKPMFYVTYQDAERKVFILNVTEDLGRFLSANGCSIKPEFFDKIKTLVRTYYHPDYQMINSLDELPDTVVRDRRMPEMRAAFKPAAVETVNGNQTLTFWFYKPEMMGLETLTMTQFEEWPMQLDAKIQCTDMENEPEAKPETKAAEAPKAEAEAPKKEAEETKKEAEAPKKEAEETKKADDEVIKSDASDSSSKDEVPAKKEDKKEDKVPAKKEDDSSMGAGTKFIIILVVLGALYLALVFGMCDGDWSLTKFLDMFMK